MTFFISNVVKAYSNVLKLVIGVKVSTSITAEEKQEAETENWDAEKHVNWVLEGIDEADSVERGLRYLLDILNFESTK